VLSDLRRWLEKKVRLHYSPISPAPRATRALCETTAGLLARKIARIAWAMMTKGERYKEPVALAA